MDAGFISPSTSGKGFRVGAGPSGGRLNLGMPGTGVGYEARLGTGRRVGRRAKSANVIQPEPKKLAPSGLGCGGVRVSFLQDRRDDDDGDHDHGQNLDPSPNPAPYGLLVGHFPVLTWHGSISLSTFL